jgi:hypothetical protein
MLLHRSFHAEGCLPRPTEKMMPILLWLLGVPLSVVILLMLFRFI